MLTPPLVAIDPGKRACGVAFFGALGRLLACATVPDPVGWARHFERVSRLPAPVRFVSEVPVRYAAQRATLRGVASLEDRVEQIRAELGSQLVQTWTPSAWKGNVPKAAHHHRVSAVLDARELDVFWASDHNARDAVALGLFALGRVGRGGVTP